MLVYVVLKDDEHYLFKFGWIEWNTSVSIPEISLLSIHSPNLKIDQEIAASTGSVVNSLAMLCDSNYLFHCQLIVVCTFFSSKQNCTNLKKLNNTLSQAMHLICTLVHCLPSQKVNKTLMIVCLYFPDVIWKRYFLYS